jgi:hypothetical protein
MRTITIEIPEPGDETCGFDVVLPDGRRCGGLGFDEMLGQVVSIAHPKLGRPHYRMETPDDWDADRAARRERLASARDIVDPNFRAT